MKKNLSSSLRLLVLSKAKKRLRPFARGIKKASAFSGASFLSSFRSGTTMPGRFFSSASEAISSISRPTSTSTSTSTLFPSSGPEAEQAKPIPVSESSKAQQSRFKASSLVKYAILIALAGYCTFEKDQIAHFLTYESGLGRSLIFWARVFPIYVHYRSIQVGGTLQSSLESRVKSSPAESFVSQITNHLGLLGDPSTPVHEQLEKRYQRTHDLYADTILELILLLRGYYIKLGQLGSLRADFLPAQWISRLETLHSDVPALPLSEVSKIICDSLAVSAKADADAVNQSPETKTKMIENVQKMTENKTKSPILAAFDGSIGSVFSHIAEKPLGAASIGQVHSASLLDGTPVVLKVQYPEVERTFRADMSTVKTFCKLAQPEFLTFLDEIEKQFMTEFDYKREAENLRTAWANLALSKNGKMAIIPKPYPELCSKKLLVMERLDGLNMTQALRKSFTAYAASKNMTLDEFMVVYRDAPPPSSTILGLSSALLWAYDMANNAASLAYNNTLGWVAEPRPYVSSPRLMDLRWIVDTLFSIHAEQIFRFGFFNGDPHPGNIMALHDGRVGLIDFGQVKRLNRKQRAILARLYIALDDKDQEAVALCFKAMGNVSKQDDPATLGLYSTLNFDYDDEEMRNGMNVQAFFEKLGKEDPLLVAAQDWVMPSRVSIMLRGFANGVQYPVKTTRFFTPAAKEFFVENPDMIIFANEAMEKVKAFDLMLKEQGLTKEQVREQQKKTLPTLIDYNE